MLFIDNSVIAGTLTVSNAGVSRIGSINATNINLSAAANRSIGTSGPMIVGVVTVANTYVTATSRIFLTIATLGAAAPAAMHVSAITPGVGFEITSADVADSSTVHYLIINQAT